MRLCKPDRAHIMPLSSWCSTWSHRIYSLPCRSQSSFGLIRSFPFGSGLSRVCDCFWSMQFILQVLTINTLPWVSQESLNLGFCTMLEFPGYGRQTECILHEADMNLQRWNTMVWIWNPPCRLALWLMSLRWECLQTLAGKVTEGCAPNCASCSH